MTKIKQVVKQKSNLLGTYIRICTLERLVHVGAWFVTKFESQKPHKSPTDVRDPALPERVVAVSALGHRAHPRDQRHTADRPGRRPGLAPVPHWWVKILL